MPTIYIYDDIGPDWLGMISAKQITDQLDEYRGQQVDLRINSPGGDVQQAQAIYNSIAGHGNVRVLIDGLAASAASYVAMAAKEIVVSENATIMIHNAWTFAAGNAADLRKSADVLDLHDAGIAAVYAARSGKPIDEVKSAMAAETWYSAQQAVDFGLADSIGQPLVVKACLKQGRYKHAPAALFTLHNHREQATARRIAEIDRQLRIARKS